MIAHIIYKSNSGPGERKTLHSPSTLYIYGDGNLLYTGEVAGGVKPVDFFVDLTGVLELKIKTVFEYSYSTKYAAIGECGLWS